MAMVEELGDRCVSCEQMGNSKLVKEFTIQVGFWDTLDGCIGRREGVWGVVSDSGKEPSPKNWRNVSNLPLSLDWDCECKNKIRIKTTSTYHKSFFFFCFLIVSYIFCVILKINY